MTSQVQVRMDRSREYSTVHGERPPGDPHVGTHFYQDGLPFDAQGVLIADHVELQGDGARATKLRDLADRKLRKASKLRVAEVPKPSVAPADDEDDDGGESAVVEGAGEGDDEDKEPVNLEAWARGEQKVIWNDVTQAIARRYSRRVSSKKDAVEFLIEQKAVAPGELSVEHQKLLQD